MEEASRVYTTGRVIRLKNWEKMSDELINAWGRTAVLLFLSWFYDFLTTWLQDPVNSLPCTISFFFFFNEQVLGIGLTLASPICYSSSITILKT